MMDAEMPTLFLKFPARRYHATPWGHHVNEGLVEWPPSPWRIIRALISVGYTSGVWNGAGPSLVARSLIEKLARTLPHYVLPPAAGAHSRHYMPIAVLNKGREQTTLVFDTWARLDGHGLAVTWRVDLSDDELMLLARLADRLGYLGRSESWVIGALVADDVTWENGLICSPDVGGSLPRRGFEQVSLLAPQSPDAYAQWRESAIAEALRVLEHKDKNISAKAREDVQAPYPVDLVACLQTETGWLKSFGWSQPPGSRRITFWRPVDALESGAPQVVRTSPRPLPAAGMLLSLTSAGGNDRLLPPRTRTLPQAELLHRALVRKAMAAGRHSAVLTGCDEHGTPLRGTHTHAHVLLLDLDGDRHLDHVLIWAPMLLDAPAQAAVRAVRQTFTKGGAAPLRLALAGTGSLESFTSIAGRAGDRLLAVLGPSGGATSWITETPFVPPRFVKKRGRHTLEGQVAAELASRGLPAPSRIVVDVPQTSDEARTHRHFVRMRRFGPPAPIDAGFTIRLEFSEPVRGPICLGYASHFGLGMFRVDSPAETR